MIYSFGFKTQKARKNHQCMLCGGAINNGEVYTSEFCVDGGYAYDFKSHNKCFVVSQEIYEYVDPEDGMCETGFCIGANEVCNEFVCPDCENRGKECQDYLCIDKLYDFFSSHELYREKGSDGKYIWKVREKALPF